MPSLLHVQMVLVVTSLIAIGAHHLASQSPARGWSLAARLAGVLALGVALNLALPLTLDVVAYDGICYGFTDGQTQCSRLEHLTHSVAWAIIMTLPVAAGYLMALLIGTGTGLALRRRPQL